VPELQRLADIFKRDAVLTAHGLVKADDKAATHVSAGNVVLIPPGIKQRITSTGKIILEYMAICSPRFSLENYNSG
tara:strand:+ start:997 stop:1224 length:228 start_codon:yes stop_codon:yes gene_type:complete